MRNKDQLIKSIIGQLEQQLSTALRASQQAHDSATHSENIAENKYDTLGLEAAYLAHGQSLRIEELGIAIDSYRKLALTVKTATEPEPVVKLGSLLELEAEQGQSRYLFIGPAAGGLWVEKVQVITPGAPLATALLSKTLDDEVTLQVDKHLQKYLIVDLQ